MMAKKQLIVCVFKDVKLLKDEILGTGSYGRVYKAKCDQLLCVAKTIEATDEDEHKFLSCINHPNIVQYLGTYYDPETNYAPVFLIELMDESLTHFLESSPRGGLPYHIQVNLSYDIAQALTFLHSNGIIHCNLSSNNVLLLASTRAKVTDFRMAKFAEVKFRQIATLTNTSAYMSPEALNEPPVFSEKLDNFSFGVLLIQIITRQLPKPTDRLKILKDLQDSQLKNQEVSVPKLERRQAHIDLISPDHPLLPTSLDCLKENENERPTAIQLCQTITDLKKTAKYQESCQQDLKQQLRDKNFQLQNKDKQILAYKKTLKMVQKTAELLMHMDQAMQDFQRMIEEKLKIIDNKLQSSERNYGARQKIIQQHVSDVKELRQVALASKNEQSLATQMHQVALQDDERLPLKSPVTVPQFSSLPDIPDDMWCGSSAVIKKKIHFKSNTGNTVYFFSDDGQWNKILCPISNCTIVSIDDTLTTAGGYSQLIRDFDCKKLYNCTNSQWVELEHFHSMSTKRWNPAVVYANNILVVAGGKFNFEPVLTVEILNTDNRQWANVNLLPIEMNALSVTICDNYVYIHPRASATDQENSVYKCSLEQLVQPQPSSAKWETITPLPVSNSSLVTINDHLLAVGGENHSTNSEDDNCTSNLYEYIDEIWTIIGKMKHPRSAPLTEVLPNNKLIVVGGLQALTKCEQVKLIVDV